MRVSVDRTASVTYANGVERNKYTVKVSWGNRSQTAEVHRMVMPPKARPRLVTMRMGSLGDLRAQLESKKGKRGIAAVNGDFFYDYRIDGDNVSLPQHASVARGLPVRVGPDWTQVVGVDKDGVPYSGGLGVGGTVTYGKKIFKINSLNWQTLGNGAVGIYTQRWADVRSAKRPSGAVEWVVKGGKITAIRTGTKTGQTVEPNTRVVAFGSNYAAAARRAQVGKPAEIALRQETAKGVPLKEAVGRGVEMVEGGRVNLTCAAKYLEQRPRTTVGWTADGNWMTLSLPGTGYDRNGYRIGGLGLAQEANVALALGFVDASELDGGGSTTAMVRRSDGNWDRVDDPDSLWQRPVPNSLIWVKPPKR
jgi:hypothetical protein